MPTSKNTGNGASAPTLSAQQLEACQLMGLTRTQCLNQIPGYQGGRDTSCPSGWRKVSYKGKTACRHQKVGDTYCYLTPGHDPQCWTASGPIPSPACVGPGCPPTGPPAVLKPTQAAQVSNGEQPPGEVIRRLAGDPCRRPPEESRQDDHTGGDLDEPVAAGYVWQLLIGG